MTRHVFAQSGVGLMERERGEVYTVKDQASILSGSRIWSHASRCG